MLSQRSSNAHKKINETDPQVQKLSLQLPFSLLIEHSVESETCNSLYDMQTNALPSSLLILLGAKTTGEIGLAADELDGFAFHNREVTLAGLSKAHPAARVARSLSVVLVFGPKVGARCCCCCQDVNVRTARPVR